MMTIGSRLKAMLRPVRAAHVPLLCSALFLVAVQAVAQGRGVVEGKIVNGTDPSIVTSGVEVEVFNPMSGMDVLKSAKTNASGGFRIDGLPTDGMLMVRTNYKAATYRARVNFDTEGKARVTIDVYEPTSSMDGITVEGLQMAFQLSGPQLRSLESYSIANGTKPPRTFTGEQGSLRFSKAPGILQVPAISVTAPGSSMPLKESPLESQDGTAYYLLYPLRPGTTTFQVEQSLPYENRAYTYRKTFYQDIGSFRVGVIPADMTLQGEGLVRVQTDKQSNFAVYQGGPVKAGTGIIWTFSGGTPVVESRPAESSVSQPRIRPMPNMVGQYALVLGPLLLMAFVGVLWYAFSLIPEESASNRDPRLKELREKRDQLLNRIANLDHLHESGSMERKEYIRQREQSKRQLRRIALLLSAKQ